MREGVAAEDEGGGVGDGSRGAGAGVGVGAAMAVSREADQVGRWTPGPEWPPAVVAGAAGTGAVTGGRALSARERN